ncbi:MAG: phosphoribosylformylglycinamidine synthase subunit PurL [Deltaproteobacteria bacterium]|nr:phosphoribosylformylglycinamidine synthase subunit PurL [Deltaproteobacteria bacterium]
MKSHPITKDIISQHGLTDEEYRSILKALGREPNLLELGIFSVMWSEHCSYKSSKVHLRNFPTTGKYVLQGPGENAGVVDIGDGLAVAFKMESHNHPSYIEPYQGAATGVGGILRDIFTMGARPIASLNSLRFGSFEHPKTRYLLNGVVAGIAGYGNCMGVPTVGGEIYFHESYNGNCLVNAMTVGIMESNKIFKGKAEGIGNLVMYVGSKTGRDGIHGATMASDVFGEGGEERRPTVQVGDPFTEKLLLEACLEVFKTDYVVGIQDMGAAGLTSSSVEMASRGGTGIDLDVSLVPCREEGMTPYEVMLSESQERMLMVVRQGCEDKVKEIFHKWDLEAVVIGIVTSSGLLRVAEGNSIAAMLPVQPLTDNAPIYKRPIKRPASQDDVQTLDLKKIPEPKNYNETLLTLLSSPNIASKEWIYRQYDHMVRTDTVVLPGSDAAVIRIKGTKKALAMTVDCNSRYCYLDPWTGGAIAVAEAARNLVCSGAKPIALTDCLNFGNPERTEIMWQFEQAVLGMSEACKKFGIPVISGNVSLYNETSGVSIYPTPTVGMVGLIEDISLHATQWFKSEGDIIILLGETKEELGGSEYLKIIHKLDKGKPPHLNLDMEAKAQEVCLNAIHDGIIKSSHDCSEGGLAVALAECCISSPANDHIGVVVNFKSTLQTPNSELRTDSLLFGESQSRIVVSLANEDVAKFMSIADKHGVSAVVIGKVGGKRLKINGIIDAAVDELKTAWQGSIERLLM